MPEIPASIVAACPVACHGLDPIAAQPDLDSRTVPLGLERTGAADAVDRVLAEVDATKQEKAERRGALTDEPAVIGKARGKGQGGKTTD